MNRPITTLFMLMSVDGKISTGETDELDFDKDLANITGVKEGLQQYYNIEQTTDLWSLNSGRVQAKIGVNKNKATSKTPISFVLIDNTHLTTQGLQYFCTRSKKFILVTSNKNHPAFFMNKENLYIIYQEKLNLVNMLEILKTKYGCERITIQTGGTLNELFLREKLFDYIDIIIAPILVGGKNTSTLIDGKSLYTTKQLSELGVLQLESVIPLDASYVRLRYKVIS
ncbi:dihydrofolate reductase family protein [Thomasclavelia sp.]